VCETSASATALFAFSGGLVAGYFQAMNENRFGMLSGPAVWQHLFEPVVVGMWRPPRRWSKAADFPPYVLRDTLGGERSAPELKLDLRSGQNTSKQ
jgi:hypothetical protein